MNKIDWKGVALLVLLAVLLTVCAACFVATSEKERAEYRAAFIGECIREGQRPYVCEYMYQSMMQGRGR